MLEVIAFFCGLQIMIELLAASYRFVDLWYRISDFWLRLSARLGFIVFADFVLLLTLPARLAEAFLWGQIGYLIFHIGIFWVIRWGLNLVRYKRS